MPEYYNVTTNLGDAEIANAIATNTKLNITHIAFGDGKGSVPTPDKARTSLVREVHRQAVTKYERHATNANWIVIETIIPSSIGGFWVREMGIIANGKLISHGSHAPFEKVADPSGVSEYRLRFTQNVTDGSVVKITLDESLIYASQAWVGENFIKRTEIVDNLTTADATKPLSAAQGKALQDSKLGKTENAVSATKLQTARTIGGVSFDGSANINLPGVNTAGNQNTTGNAATATTAAACSGNAATATTAAACSGNAATATKLQTARTIGGVSFDGSANINLPGVNTAGNQNTTGNAATATTAAACSGNAATATTAAACSGNAATATTAAACSGNAATATTAAACSGNAATATTAAACSGNAATATKLQTARTIGGVSFDGSANINLPGVNTAGNQNTTGNAATATTAAACSGNAATATTAAACSGNAATATTAAACSGNAATATKLQTARTIGGVSFDGSANINLPGVNTAGNQNTTGNAATATTAAACSGNAATATKLQTARNIALAGAVLGNVDFDGSGNITINTQLKENTAVVRAFCSFNGTGTPVILAESNIASISVSSLKFTVTFKTPMPHANYVINGFASDVTNSNRVAAITMNPDMIPSKTVNGFDFYARYSSNASTNIASPLICFSIVC